MTKHDDSFGAAMRAMSGVGMAATGLGRWARTAIDAAVAAEEKAATDAVRARDSIEQCPTEWSAVDGYVHRCLKIGPHDFDHECGCGDRCEQLRPPR